jgi:hypothetical protein
MYFILKYNIQSLEDRIYLIEPFPNGLPKPKVGGELEESIRGRKM